MSDERRAAVAAMGCGLALISLGCLGQTPAPSHEWHPNQRIGMKPRGTIARLELPNHAMSISSLACSPDGRWIAIGAPWKDDYLDSLAMLDTAAPNLGTPLLLTRPEASTGPVAWTSSNTAIFDCMAPRSSVCAWNPGDTRFHRLSPEGFYASDATLAGNAVTYVTSPDRADAERYVATLDLTTGVAKREFDALSSEGSPTLNPERTTMAFTRCAPSTSFTDYCAKEWVVARSMVDGAERVLTDVDGKTEVGAFLSDGSLVTHSAIRDADGRIDSFDLVVRDIANPAAAPKTVARDVWPERVHYAADGSLVTWPEEAGTVALMSVATGEVRHLDLGLHEGAIAAAAPCFTADGHARLVVVGSVYLAHPRMGSDVYLVDLEAQPAAPAPDLDQVRQK